MMKLRVANDRLFVNGPARHEAVVASIPGSRWNKRFFCWTFPASPISAIRIMHVAKQDPEVTEVCDKTQELLNEWQRIKDAQHWKTDVGRKDILDGYGKPFMTVTTPYPHQVACARFIAGRKAAYLALEMGTGKTMVIINELLWTRPAYSLIACPKTVIDVWISEFETHAPDHGFELIPLVKGSSAKKLELMEEKLRLASYKGVPAVVIVNYESIVRGALKDPILSTPWDYVVADEGHRLKAPDGKTSKHFAKLTWPIKRILSGTPFPNTKLDGYGQFRFLDPGLFGTSHARHRSEYAVMGGYQNHQIISYVNEEKFNKLINLMMFRVDADVLDLPPEIVTFRSVEMPPVAWKAYHEMNQDLITFLNSGEVVTAANALARLMKLREVTAGFLFDEDGIAHQLHDGRREAFKEVCQEIGDQKIVVFAEFKYDLKIIREVAAELKRGYGEVSGDANDLVGAQYPPDVEILGVQPQSGSHGINLQASHHALFFTTGFNYADHLQSKKRLLRGGQKHPVRMIHLVVKNTIDQRAYTALKQKADVMAEVLDYVKAGGQ